MIFAKSSLITSGVIIISLLQSMSSYAGNNAAVSNNNIIGTGVTSKAEMKVSAEVVKPCEITVSEIETVETLTSKCAEGPAPSSKDVEIKEDQDNKEKK